MEGYARRIKQIADSVVLQPQSRTIDHCNERGGLETIIKGNGLTLGGGGVGGDGGGGEGEGEGKGRGEGGRV